MSHLLVTAPSSLVGTVPGRTYASDLTDEQWTLLEPVLNGCQWRFLPESFGPWTPVWSQFRRWSRSGTWARALTALHEAAREADGRTETTPSMVVIDTHLARGASNGGFTFHDRGGPYGHADLGVPSVRAASVIVMLDIVRAAGPIGT